MNRLPFGIAIFGIAGAACLAPSIALGGQVSSLTVFVGNNPDGSGYFEGSLAAARYSPDSVADIGCAVDALGTPPVQCWARSSGNQYGSCTTTSATAITAVSGLNAASGLLVAWDKTGTCTTIVVLNDSALLH